MSKIALSGDASGTGTFTIASPNSNNNRTLTLPDATGTVAVSGSAVTFTTLDVGAGSASTPSLTFTGDTNTGIYSPGADRIGFAEGGTQVAEFDASGNFLFNSGYGSVATAYGCRAWVNFDGTAAGTFAGGTSTVTRASGSTTATITTTTAHGLITGNSVYALTGVVAGTYTVTVTGTTTFTITTVATTALTAASITFAVNSIRASGNVSSIADNATADYTVNFATAMPDANYVVEATCGNTYAAAASSFGFVGNAINSTTSSVRIGVIRAFDNNLFDTNTNGIAIFR